MPEGSRKLKAIDDVEINPRPGCRGTSTAGEGKRTCKCICVIYGVTELPEGI